MSIDEKSEEDFGMWLESIEFIDKDGNTVEPQLTEDITIDPEGDRS